MPSKRCVFLLPTLGEYAHRGDAMTAHDMGVLNRTAERLDLDAHVVFVSHDQACAGNTKKLSVKMMRADRERVLDEIRSIEPDFIVCLGPAALQCAVNKGNTPLTEYMRRSFDFVGLDGIPTYATQSLDMVRAKPGAEKWLTLDIRAAVDGYTQTTWGDYSVLLPDDPKWDACPADFVDMPAGTMVGFDLETYPGLDPWADDARIRMAVIARHPGKAYVVQCTPDSRLPQWLADICLVPTSVKCGSNIKFDMRWMQRFGYGIVNVHDTSTTEHILDETDPFKDLKSLTFRYLPRLADYSAGHRALVADRGGWAFVGDDEQYEYAGADGEASVAAALAQRHRLYEGPEGLRNAYRLMHDLYPVLAQMESRGVRVDVDENRRLDTRFARELDDVRDRICATLGPINPNSPAQLVDALFEYVPNIDLRKAHVVRQLAASYYRLPDDDEESYSTQRAVLEREASKHPVIEDVLLWRRLQKLHGTYVTGLYDKHLVQRNGMHFVHTNYRTDVVETCRLSCAAGWTPVVTEDGEKRIDCVLEGDRVLTHRGKWKRVTRAWCKGVEDMYTYLLSNGRSITVTDKHRFLRSDGKWINAKEVRDALGVRTKEHRNSAGAVPIQGDFDSAAGCGPAGSVVHNSSSHAKEQHEAGRARGPKEAAVFRVQNGAAEPHDRENRRPAPGLQGGLPGLQGVLDAEDRRPTRVRAQRYTGAGVGVEEPAGAVGCASHRRRRGEQQSRQSGAMHKERPQGNTLLAGPGHKSVEVTQAFYCGRVEVFDITVEDDHSYVACGVISHNSQNPNLQNIPKRPEPGDKHPIPPELNIKNQYVSRFPGGLFLEADLSQAEIRVAAWLAQDQKMIDAILSGQDLHRELASKMLRKPVDKVTDLERHNCKRLTFLVLYGGGANTLSAQLGIEKDAAGALIDQYFATFDKLYDYIERVKARVKRDLYVESPFGFRRRFVAPANWNTWDGWRAERQAFNFMVQNTAVCLNYVAMINLENRMRAEGLRSQMVLQVHDSVGIDLHPDEVEIVPALAVNTLKQGGLAYGVYFTLPLDADCAIGPSWGAAKKS